MFNAYFGISHLSLGAGLAALAGLGSVFAFTSHETIGAPPAPTSASTPLSASASAAPAPIVGSVGAPAGILAAGVAYGLYFTLKRPSGRA
ncbi:MAG: hypothetical protein WB816_14430 [Methylocystis sp.]